MPRQKSQHLLTTRRNIIKLMQKGKVRKNNWYNIYIYIYIYICLELKKGDIASIPLMHICMLVPRHFFGCFKYIMILREVTQIE
jgi:hypothetical protein